MKRLLPIIIILGVLVFAIGIVVYITQTKSASNENTNQSQANSTAPKPSPTLGPVKTGVPGADPPHTIGPANAPGKIEEFGDFECQPCGLFHHILKQIHDD